MRVGPAMRCFWIAAFALLCLVVGPVAAAIPALTARVTDTTGTLDAAQVQSLESRLAAFEARKGSQIAVLIVPTTGDENLEQYSIQVVEAWKLGRKGVDDGILVLVAKDDHKVRIEVGRGLEGAVPDALANRIIDETIVPKLRQGNFADGLNDGISRLIGLVDGEPLPPPPAQAHRSSKIDGQIVPAVFAFIVARALFSFLGAFVRGVLVGGVVCAVALVAGASFGFAAFLAVIGFVLGMAASTGGGRYSGGSGWGGWGGGSSGGGFGGFSGGGGGFSGGGASGGW